VLGPDLRFHQYIHQYQPFDDVCLELRRRINERSDKSESHIRKSSVVHRDTDCNRWSGFEHKLEVGHVQAAQLLLK